jgi:hypothetical protein
VKGIEKAAIGTGRKVIGTRLAREKAVGSSSLGFLD